jgi:Selenocysteine lyase
MDMSKFQKIRMDQFPLAEKCVYLDTATTGLFSRRGRDAMVGFIDARFENGMDIYMFNKTWEYADALRKTAAEVINADSDEIFFGDTGSGMLNVFSSGIPLQEHANVVVSGLSFPSTPYNWMNRVGEENVRIAEPEDGALPCEKIFELVDDNTAVIALCLVENTSGWRHDIKTIGDFCKREGVYLVLDITQCIGAMNVDVKKTHVDFLVGTSYKWISGPFGAAVGYCSRRVLHKIHPTYVGWTGNKDRNNHSRYKLALMDAACRFETGSLNWIGLKGIEQSMKLYLELGKQDVEDYILGLTQYLYDRTHELNAVKLVGPFLEKNRSGIVFLTFPEEWKLSDREVQEAGIRLHVATPSSMRVSLHYYNNREDVDKLIDYLKSLEKHPQG